MPPLVGLDSYVGMTTVGSVKREMHKEGRGMMHGVDLFTSKKALAPSTALFKAMSMSWLAIKH